MRVVLEILNGPLTGHTVELNPGQSVSGGRTAKSQLMLPHDSFLSGLHFVVECTGEACILRDCNSSNGTWVNGNRVSEQVLNDGDQIAAGQTRLLVSLRTEEAVPRQQRTSTVLFAIPKYETMEQAVAPAPPLQTLTPVQQAVLGFLQRLSVPLYAVLDAFAEPRVQQWLAGSGGAHQYLFEGLETGDQPPPALLLVQLPLDSPLLASLIQEGWGRHWITFLACSSPFAEVRQHLQQILMVHTEDGRRFCSRLHDPRILQFLLPACAAHELAQLFGPILGFFVEDAFDPRRLVGFSASAQGLQQNVVDLV
ncbi:MAG: DUF4123 domain-containing protein [Acidobacteria bacterium]|nr:DUF4123 domain-containing protein [Acidobacteriota bacterium]